MDRRERTEARSGIAERGPAEGLHPRVLCQVLRAVAGRRAPGPLATAALEALVAAGWASGGGVYTPGEEGTLSLVAARWGEGCPGEEAAQALAARCMEQGAAMEEVTWCEGVTWHLLAVPLPFRGQVLGVLVAARPHSADGAMARWLQEGEAMGLLLGMALGCLRLEAGLQARQQERDLLLQRLLQAQEEERRRIARGLHDDISQALLAISLRIDDLRDRCAPQGPPLERADFSALKQAVYQALEEVHRIIFNLRPKILDDMGLMPAIMWLAEQELQRRGVEVTLEVKGRQRRLPDVVETVAFRVVLEAVQNIRRHARAASAHLVLIFAPEALEILVQDDGQGFRPECAQPRAGSMRGLGLLGMQERLALVGGTVSISSA
ncbi:MAG: sensor histidine kinase, partial [Anaerolineae bacterium]|nr:sensor histidine kinase [Anaerolineae bacterium]